MILNRTFILQNVIALIIIINLNKCSTNGSILTNNATHRIIADKPTDDYVKITYFTARNFCIPSDPLEHFPELFTLDQLRHGAILLHIFGAIYFFIILAIVTNSYFLPTVECICEDLKIPKHLAAATFMASATAMPEFFTNTIGTLITESDIGLGTIIGSLMFNTLGGVAVASMCAKTPVQLDWWPVTRDSFMFFINILLLMVVSWGDEITFNESAVMILFLILYFVILFLDSRCMPPIRSLLEDQLNWCKSTTERRNTMQEISDQISYVEGNNSKEMNLNNEHESQPIEENPNPENVPELTIKKNIWIVVWRIYSFPIKIFLKCTIPDPVKHRKFYPLTFVMCIVVIGCDSYMVVWMLSMLGATLNLPEIVIGLTFLAAGSTLPETLSSIIAIRKGETGIGVSNSLGSNSLAILLSLGVPWFIKNAMHLKDSDKHFIQVNSQGIEITVGILAISLISLYLVLSFGGFQLNQRVGFILIGLYCMYTTCQILLEMDILFPSENFCI